MSRHHRNWIDGFIKYTQNEEPCTLYKKWVAVSVVASVLQRKCYLDLGRNIFHTNQFIVLVGPPAARKGTAMNPAREMLEELGIPLAADVTSIQALIRHLASLCSGDLITLDEEGIPVDHASLTVFSGELSIFLGDRDRRLTNILTDMYDCKKSVWKYDLVSRDSDNIRGLWVNLLGATTPEAMRTEMSPELIGKGLVSRMIFIYAGNKGKSNAFPIETEEERELRKTLLADLGAIHRLVGEFSLTNEYKVLYEEWYDTDVKGDIGHNRYFDGYIARRGAHVHKLAMVMSAARGDSLNLTATDFKLARSTLEEAEIEMPLAFMGIGRRSEAAVKADLLRILQDFGEIPFKQILKEFSYDADKDTLMGLVVELVIEGIAEFVGEKKGVSSVIKYKSNM